MPQLPITVQSAIPRAAVQRKGLSVDKEDRAGGSADDAAAAMRAKAERLIRAADNWAAGAAGERRTAEVLDTCRGRGWYVRHDLAIPGSKANIDHVVVCPAGVIVVDSKNWAGAVRAGGGTLWVGRFPKRNELDKLTWEVGRVSAMLTETLPNMNLHPTGLISLTSAESERALLEAGGIKAVHVDSLVGHLCEGRQVLTEEQIRTVSAALDYSLSSRTAPRSPRGASGQPTVGSAPATGTARAERGPLERISPAPPAPRAPRRPSNSGYPGNQGMISLGPTRRIRTNNVRSRVVHSRPRRPSRRGAAQSGGIAAPIAAIVVSWFLLHSLSHHASPPSATGAPVAASPNVASGGPIGPATTTPSPTTPPLQVTWSCAAPALGWVASFQWPSGVTEASWMIETATSPSGPWKFVAEGVPSQPVRLTGIHAGTAEWVRVGTISSLEISGIAAMAGQLSTPSGC